MDSRAVSNQERVMMARVFIETNLNSSDTKSLVTLIFLFLPIEDGEIASFKQRRTAWNCPGIGLKTQSNSGPAEASKIG